MWPPDKKLKLGIDLSGGTILVYEVERENLPPGFNMDELIAALKKRADPEGVKEIPIRKIGGNRIEIILPQASNEEVEEVKKMLTDVGSLEFRILANGKHDKDVVKRGPGPRRAGQAAARYKWARLGEISTGTNPTFTSDTITDPPADLEEGPLRRHRSHARRARTSAGTARTEVVKVRRNTRQHVDPRQAAWPEVDRVVSDRVQPQPDQGGRPQQPGPQRLDRPRGKGRPGPDRDLDPLQPRPAGQEVTGKYLKQVQPDVDDRLQPAVRFEFDSRGASRFGRLTREHQPEEGGAFRYQLAILLDNLVMSAPGDQLRDPRLGDHRRGAAGLQGEGSRAPDPGACGPAACRRA